MEISASKINEWVKIDRRRKVRAEHRREFFGQVRGIFILLLFAAILVFVFNHYVEIQDYASAKLAAVIKKEISADNKLRQGAVNYEHQVDQIAQ